MWFTERKICGLTYPGNLQFAASFRKSEARGRVFLIKFPQSARLTSVPLYAENL
jgi:hypothetical protein